MMTPTHNVVPGPDPSIVRRGRRANTAGFSLLELLIVATMLVAVMACGVLSFNYSRDRLGGMAVPFYALAAFFALRAAFCSLDCVE